MNYDISKSIASLLKQLKIKKPLIHNITNYVTVNDCANVLLAIGASPIMADDLKETEDITKISSALVLNIGTLNERTIKSMIASGKKANQLNIPVIFDPVGAGASSFRNETTKLILNEVKINVLRGNMSEIRFIAGLQSETKGVDASIKDMKSGNEEAAYVTKKIANKFNCTVAITGATDIISDGERIAFVENGTKMLSNVTGTGCMTSALIGAFCGVSCDYFIAAISGIVSMGIGGEIAEQKSDYRGLGSFHIGIIDAISNLNDNIILNRAKIN